MDMIEQLRTQIAERLAERSKLRTELDGVLRAPTDEKRGLNDAETLKFAELRDGMGDIDTQIDDMQARVDELTELNRRTEEREKLAKELQPTPTPQQVRVTSDEPTYRKGGKHSFFADAFAMRFNYGDSFAAERLNRHMNEVRLGDHGMEHRDVGTSAFGALVVPQYLPEMYAEILRAGRVTANLCSPHDLPPEGMTLTIPRGTTGTGVSAQTAENDAVNETNYGGTDLVVNVRTYAGQQDVSRQAIERGRGTDEVIYADLASAYAVAIDTGVINGTGANGQHAGILGTTGIYTVTSTAATPSSVIRNIADAIQRVNGGRFLPADTIVMHPRRWGWLSVATDSSGRPLVVTGNAQNNPQNTFGVGPEPEYGFTGGSIMGLPVYTDANIPTSISTSGYVAASSEDVMLVVRRADLHLWEDSVAPRQFRFEETLGGNLTVKLVIAGYSAFTAGHHPEGVAKITGSAFILPVF